MIRLAILLICISALASGGATGEEAESDSRLHGRWFGTKIRGQELKSARRPYVEFPTGRVSGYDGCNYFVLSATVSKGRIRTKADDQMQTLRDCPDYDKRFVANVAVAVTYQIAEKTLILIDEAGFEVLRLQLD